ncbi:hypothetical protein Lal_00032164 [Lupinus albus]|uniref:Uncharacterized protein n=1 Tax=Lupinus albus TaxID=3870 RepID=A0A6A4NWX2_LUPAL|nr:hypothetical protein Lalb_Chr20g0115991 [Lupinus albus]KAF1881693.1 hypothetical protein Lal_00032164 [Lupinus albus]
MGIPFPFIGDNQKAELLVTPPLLRFLYCVRPRSETKCSRRLHGVLTLQYPCVISNSGGPFAGGDHRPREPSLLPS